MSFGLLGSCGREPEVATREGKEGKQWLWVVCPHWWREGDTTPYQRQWLACAIIAILSWRLT
jgi:hypothetical protein